MTKKSYGLIILLFSLSVLSLELFLVQIIRHFAVQASLNISIPYLLFVLFPMNIGFYIPVVLTIIGIIMIFKK